MDDTVTAFRKDGRYTDIRVAIRDLLAKVPEASKGMIVLIDDEGEFHMVHVCKAMELSYIGADCLYNSFVPSEK